MKAILEFELPCDKETFETSVKATQLSIVLTEFDNYLRQKLKHEELSQEEYKIYESIREKFWEIAKEHEVNGLI